MRGGVHGQMKMVWLECKKCGHRIFIWRRKSRLKEREHIKDYWCRRCQEVTKHREVREGQE